MSPRQRLTQLLDLLDARLGWRAWRDALRGLPLDGPPSWARVPGAVFLGALALQVCTGVALASFYAPGTTSAWGSVFYLEEQVVLGSVLRGLHAFGAGAVYNRLGQILENGGVPTFMTANRGLLCLNAFVRHRLTRHSRYRGEWLI